MIYIVQVIPYTSNNGCSVRIGKGLDHTVVLGCGQCSYFDFVETSSEVKEAIKVIEKLPDYYRQKDISIQKLRIYSKMYEENNSRTWDTRMPWGTIKSSINSALAIKQPFTL
jgi:hypothetical protein